MTDTTVDETLEAPRFKEKVMWGLVGMCGSLILVIFAMAVWIYKSEAQKIDDHIASDLVIRLSQEQKFSDLDKHYTIDEVQIKAVQEQMADLKKAQAENGTKLDAILKELQRR